jgi:phosphatidylglycerol---prolipoprotein diacylglyceryl transferase
MRTTLFFIPMEVGGWPVFGPGLLLAIWALASLALLTWLAWRQGWNADTWGYVPILLLVGAIIRWMLPVLCVPQQGLPIRGFGLMNMLGVIAGTSLAAWRAKRRGLDPDLIFSLAFWMLVPGIIGARAFYVTEYWKTEYLPAYTAPNGSLGALVAVVVNLTQGGLVIYGAFFGAVVGVILFVRKYKLPLLPLCDLITPSMVLGLALGRVGCLLNGCCFGGVCDHGWAIEFPADAPAYLAQIRSGQMYGFKLTRDLKAEPSVVAVIPDSPADHAGLKPDDLLKSINEYALPTSDYASAVLEQAFYQHQPLQIERENGPAVTVPALDPPKHSLPVHPTQVYSVLDGLALCLALLLFSRFSRRDGAVFALLMSTYPVTRFYIESLRSDEAPIFGTGMSISQNVSLVLLVGAVVLWIYIFRQPKRTG